MKYRAFALIALVLCLAACAGEKVQLPKNLFDHPTAILCNIHGGQPRRIEVPAGKNPRDLCPGAITARFYNIAPGVHYSGLAYDNIPPPVGRLPTNKTSGQPP